MGTDYLQAIRELSVAFNEDFLRVLSTRGIATQASPAVIQAAVRGVFGGRELTSKDMDEMFLVAPPYSSSVSVLSAEAGLGIDADLYLSFQVELRYGAPAAKVGVWEIAFVRMGAHPAYVRVVSSDLDRNHFGKGVSAQLLQSLLRWSRLHGLEYFLVDALGIGRYLYPKLGFSLPTHSFYRDYAADAEQQIATLLREYLVTTVGLSEEAAYRLMAQYSDISDLASVGIQQGEDIFEVGKDFLLSLSDAKLAPLIVELPLDPNHVRFIRASSLLQLAVSINS